MIIYKATNKINGKIYIGQTVKKLKKRISEHKSDSKRRNDPFPRAICKYGVDGFTWEIIEICRSQNELDLAEIKWISLHNSQDRSLGYNVAIGGNPGKDIGRKNLSKLWETDDFRQKMKSATRAGARKLIDEEIGIIKEAYKIYGDVKCLANVFGVFRTTIEAIVYGKSWEDISSVPETLWPIEIKNKIQQTIHEFAERRKESIAKHGEKKRILCKKQIAFIRFMKAKNVNMKVLSEYFNVSYSLTNKIGYGGKFPEIEPENCFPELIEEIMKLNEKRRQENKNKSRDQLRINCNR